MSPGGSGVRWLSCGALGERDQRSEFRFCARATRSKNADRRPQRPRPSSYLSAGDSHRLFKCSPKSNPRETDRKRQAITVYPRQVIYFFPTRPPGCLWGARLAPRACPGHVLQAAGGKGAASRGLSDLGSQQQQARSHVRAAGARGRCWAGPGTGMEWRHYVPRPAHPPHGQQRGAGGCGSVDTAQTTGSRSYRGYGPG